MVLPSPALCAPSTSTSHGLWALTPIFLSVVFEQALVTSETDPLSACFAEGLELKYSRGWLNALAAGYTVLSLGTVLWN